MIVLACSSVCFFFLEQVIITQINIIYLIITTVKNTTHQ